MQGSSAVVDALNGAYRLMITIEQQAHMQEHVLESQKWKKLSDWFDDIEEKGHTKVIHPLMGRICDLEGTLDPRYAFDAQCWPVQDIGLALASMLRHLIDLRSAFIEVCEAAEDVDDYVTESLVWEWQTWVEHKMRKFERRIAKLETLGLKPFLAEMMDR